MDTTLFTIAEEANHERANPQCPECWEDYPEPCQCGGLIHAAGGEVEDEDGNVWVTTMCDQCGRSEEDLEEELGREPR
jgi:hypothetical protein